MTQTMNINLIDALTEAANLLQDAAELLDLGQADGPSDTLTHAQRVMNSRINRWVVHLQSFRHEMADDLPTLEAEDLAA